MCRMDIVTYCSQLALCRQAEEDEIATLRVRRRRLLLRRQQRRQRFIVLCLLISAFLYQSSSPSLTHLPPNVYTDMSHVRVTSEIIVNMSCFVLQMCMHVLTIPFSNGSANRSEQNRTDWSVCTLCCRTLWNGQNDYFG